MYALWAKDHPERLKQLRRHGRGRCRLGQSRQFDGIVSRSGCDDRTIARCIAEQMRHHKKLSANRQATRINERCVWNAACSVRGQIDMSQLWGIVLPLVVLKWLNDVNEVPEGLKDGRRSGLSAGPDQGLRSVICPGSAQWGQIIRGARGICHRLDRAFRDLARLNPELGDVFRLMQFPRRERLQPANADKVLFKLGRALDSNWHWGLKDAQPDALGNAYEFMLGRFAAADGGGEYYTPPSVGALMAALLDPKPNNTIYDPCVGSGGLLLAFGKHLKKVQCRPRHGRDHAITVRYFGQDSSKTATAMAEINMLFHGMAARIALGDSLQRSMLRDERQLCDLVVANPPWNQTDFIVPEAYCEDVRFPGVPVRADWVWVQQMLASLSSDGRLAVVLDNGAVNCGSATGGSHCEQNIRRAQERFRFSRSISAVGEESLAVVGCD